MLWVRRRSRLPWRNAACPQHSFAIVHQHPGYIRWASCKQGTSKAVMMEASRRSVTRPHTVLCPLPAVEDFTSVPSARRPPAQLGSGRSRAVGLCAVPRVQILPARCRDHSMSSASLRNARRTSSSIRTFSRFPASYSACFRPALIAGPGGIHDPTHVRARTQPAQRIHASMVV